MEGGVSGSLGANANAEEIWAPQPERGTAITLYLPPVQRTAREATLRWPSASRQSVEVR